MNLHRLDFVSLSLFTPVVRTGSIGKGHGQGVLGVGRLRAVPFTPEQVLAALADAQARRT